MGSCVKDIVDGHGVNVGTLIQTVADDLVGIERNGVGQIVLRIGNIHNADNVSIRLNPWAAGQISEALIESREMVLNPPKLDGEFTPEERAQIRRQLAI